MRPLYTLLRNHFYSWRHAAQMVREQPRLKIAVIAGFSFVWLAGLSTLFYEGFDFLQELGGVGSWLIPQLFTLFFMGLGVMLILSGAITGYSNLYQTSETRRLLSWPVPLRDLLYYKLVQSVLMSSWAFFFVILPFIGAYAVLEKWHWIVMLGTIVYAIPFVFLLSGIGMAVMIPFVRFAPRGRTLGLLGFAAALWLVLWLTGMIDHFREEETSDLVRLSELIPGMALARSPLTPNFWMAEGILSLSRGLWGRSLFFLLLLGSSVGVLVQLILLLGRWFFYEGFQREVVNSSEQATKASLVSRVLYAFAPPGHTYRAFALKDALIFLRDPSQWTQFAIFFGLLGLYFANLRSLGYNAVGSNWSNLVAFLNMFSLSAVMSSLSSRFVYPQLSMEGKALWIVGLAPTTLSRVMVTKFLKAFLGLGIVGVGLSSFSNSMLEIPQSSQWVSRVMMPSVAFALAGMSSGLGAVFMDCSARTPTQILSGFGGTLNLILTLVVVILLVLIPGVVSHMLLVGTLAGAWAPYAVPLLCLYMILLAGLAGGVSLWMGHQALASRDF